MLVDTGVARIVGGIHAPVDHRPVAHDLEAGVGHIGHFIEAVVRVADAELLAVVTAQLGYTRVERIQRGVADGHGQVGGEGHLQGGQVLDVDRLLAAAGVIAVIVGGPGADNGAEAAGVGIALVGITGLLNAAIIAAEGLARQREIGGVVGTVDGHVGGAADARGHLVDDVDVADTLAAQPGRIGDAQRNLYGTQQQIVTIEIDVLLEGDAVAAHLVGLDAAVVVAIVVEGDGVHQRGAVGLEGHLALEFTNGCRCVVVEDGNEQLAGGGVAAVVGGGIGHRILSGGNVGKGREAGAELPVDRYCHVAALVGGRQLGQRHRCGAGIGVGVDRQRGGALDDRGRLVGHFDELLGKALFVATQIGDEPGAHQALTAAAGHLLAGELRDREISEGSVIEGKARHRRLTGDRKIVGIVGAADQRGGRLAVAVRGVHHVGDAEAAQVDRLHTGSRVALRVGGAPGALDVRGNFFVLVGGEAGVVGEYIRIAQVGGGQRRYVVAHGGVAQLVGAGGHVGGHQRIHAGDDGRREIHHGEIGRAGVAARQVRHRHRKRLPEVLTVHGIAVVVALAIGYVDREGRRAARAARKYFRCLDTVGTVGFERDRNITVTAQRALCLYASRQEKHPQQCPVPQGHEKYGPGTPERLPGEC